MSGSIVDAAIRRLGRFDGKLSMDSVLLGILKEHLGSVEEVNRILSEGLRGEPTLGPELRCKASLRGAGEGRGNG